MTPWAQEGEDWGWWWRGVCVILVAATIVVSATIVLSADIVESDIIVVSAVIVQRNP